MCVQAWTDHGEGGTGEKGQGHGGARRPVEERLAHLGFIYRLFDCRESCFREGVVTRDRFPMEVIPLMMINPMPSVPSGPHSQQPASTYPLERPPGPLPVRLGHAGLHLLQYFVALRCNG